MSEQPPPHQPADPVPADPVPEEQAPEEPQAQPVAGGHDDGPPAQGEGAPDSH